MLNRRQLARSPGSNSPRSTTLIRSPLPIWRAPVYRTPAFFTVTAQLGRLIWRIMRFAARHPLATLLTLLAYEVWRAVSWPGIIALVLITTGVLVMWRLRWPASFTRCLHRGFGVFLCRVRTAWPGWLTL